MAEDSINPRRRGKIAQCPRPIREEICRKLDDGRQGPEILAWANAQPEVIALCKEKFEGEMISDNNLSQWFKGGFQDWKAEQTKVEETQAKMEFSIRLAEAAGGNMSQGVLAIAAGRIMTALEGAEGKELVALSRAAVNLRGKELDSEKVDLTRERNKQRDEMLALEREKFQRLATKYFIDWAENKEALEIATSDDPEPVKMDKLVTLMFGERPSPAPA